MTGTRLEPVLSGLDFPECPRWHDGALWFVDMQSRRIYRSFDGTAEIMATLTDAPGGIGWRNGDLMVVSMHARRLLSVRGGTQRTVADLRPLATGMCNDMYVSPMGHMYVGVLDALTSTPEPSVALLVRPDGSVTVAAQRLLRPNGWGLSPDGHRLILAESAGERLTAFEVLPDGSLGPPQLYASLPGRQPDGICIDRLGGVWLADLAAKAVVRVEEGGEVTDVITTGERFAVACVLGGSDGRQLFVCTCDHVRPFDGGPPGTGRIDVANVTVPGAG